MKNINQIMIIGLIHVFCIAAYGQVYTPNGTVVLRSSLL
jgi:hypothetical protein